MTLGLKKFSDYNALDGAVLRGDETLLLADTQSTGTRTATTISAVAASNTISDSGAALPVVKPGALVLVSGFTDTEGELNALHTVVSSTPSNLVVETDITVNESAGQSVTVSEVAAMYQVSLSELAIYTGGGAQASVVVTEATTSRSLTTADENKYLRCTAAGGCAITVPAQASVAWADNVEIHGRGTANSVTFVEDTGVTISVPAGFELEAGSGSAWTLKREAENEWVLIGALVETV